MAVESTDLLLVQRGTQPYRSSADDVASFVNSQITLGSGGDIPITSSSQLGVLKVGNNLNVTADGTVNAVTPSGLEFQGLWQDPATVPDMSGAISGEFYIWNGVIATLNNVGWGSLNGTQVDPGDRLLWTADDDWANYPFSIGGHGIIEVTGTAPIVVNDTDEDSPDISITAATASAAGSMSAADKSKLDGIASGAQVNVNPTQSYSTASSTGTLTLSPGGDTTQIPAATTSAAGLMSAADKTNLDNISSNPSGVASVTAGNGITITGAAATPQVATTYGTAPNGTPVSSMPYDISMLGDLP